MSDPAPDALSRTHCRLDDLAEGLSHRGAIESIDAERIVGWCLDAATPSLSTPLELSCDDLSFAVIRPDRPRRDIAALVGQPLRCGFSYAWSEMPARQREALCAHLSASAEPDSPVRIEARIRTAALALDVSIAYGKSVPTRRALLTTLQQLAQRPTRSRIAERETLLSSLAPVSQQGPQPRVRAIAFYLPQFHPIPENDQWWGKGFTEWTHVVQARPLFNGHEQPRVPAELGYYDLRAPGVIERQIELAQSHGLDGFCFHHYWFAGRRLLDAPLDRFVALDHDFGFCLCWANEPWSRRWDGSEEEVLMPQPHSVEDDVRFISDALPYLLDRRYIRFDDKPVVVIYRIGLMQDPKYVIGRWRQIAEANGLSGLHVLMAETFGASDPQTHGCDGAVEFPPHKVKVTPLGGNTRPVHGLAKGFCGRIYDYAEAVANELLAAEPPYPRFKTVMLGWDNSSRRGLAAHVFSGFHPALFEAWLEEACLRTETRWKSYENRLLFINAWNEWGEGTYLEPDRRRGRALLQITRQVIHGSDSSDAALEVLRTRLQGDDAACRALDRIQRKIFHLERALQYSAALRDDSSPIQPVPLTALEPAGLSPLHVQGEAGLEQFGVPTERHEAWVHRGDPLPCSAWADPGDRSLHRETLAYLKFTALSDASQSRYGLITTRRIREDLAAGEEDVEPTTTMPAQIDAPHAANTSRPRWWSWHSPRLQPPAPSSVKAPEPEPRDIRWSAFSVTVATTHLPPGRYSVSVVFPASESDHGMAVETPLGGILDVAE